MISTPPLTRQRSAISWQRELAQAVSDPAELCRLLELDPQLLAGSEAARAQFHLRVPRGFVRRMRRGDAADPLLRQVLPLAAECAEIEGFVGDPLDEQAAMRAPGLLQKYHGRALLIATEACAVHCRYCFRREFPYSDTHSGGPRWAAALEALASDPSITELILSGGDPLSLSNVRLAQLTDELRQIPHLRRLRLHTRTPIVLPERIDDALLDWLASLPWPTAMVVHCNHANEIDAPVREAMALVRARGVTLLNQSVLLAGVNDSTPALTTLSEELWAAGILPYYLHLLDPVRGTAHFSVTESHAVRLMRELMSHLPGYLVPRLVRESPGAPSKTPVLVSGWDTLHSLSQRRC
ncbi:MAG TPA: EF-P beta-lysylation protein EpmB [Steroidobacteraceae bacterium]|nr:EF-P beta-lysylation protein EpmB [Steroidobacteraceae bacterium]